MKKNSKNNFIYDFVEKNQVILEKTESISVTIFIIGFLCFFLQIQGAKFILIIGSVLTAISFYLHSYKMIDFTDMENKSKIYDRIFYLRLIICLALLGVLTNYNGLIKII